MTKIHELLAAEKTAVGAWTKILNDTTSKFKNVDSYFSGHTKSLSMIESSEANTKIEDAAREQKNVVTNVHDTLDSAFGIMKRYQNLRFEKSRANAIARGTVMWNGQELLKDVPVDALLGLESLVKQIREAYLHIPTLDATKEWVKDPQTGTHVWKLAATEDLTKTEKVMTPVRLAAPTDKHPEQVEKVIKDVVVGKFSVMKRSGAVTAAQKAEALTAVDDLLIEIKGAITRANDTTIVKSNETEELIKVLLAPFKTA